MARQDRLPGRTRPACCRPDHGRFDGSQDFLLVERPGRGSEPAVITIKLKRTGTISGRIVDENARPVAGQVVEVWSRGVVAPGCCPISSASRKAPCARARTARSRRRPSSSKARPTAWPFASRAQTRFFPTGSRSRTSRHTLPLLVQRPLRTIRGRVVDRQGKPVAGCPRFPDRRWAGSHRDDDRRGRPFFAGRVPPRARVPVRPRRRISPARATDQGDRNERNGRIDPRQRAAGAGK